MKLLVICGPTATGKTALALTLAKEFDGELVSADSRQVYRGMDIGTGKDINLEFRISNLEFREVQYQNKNYRIPRHIIEGIPLWMYDVVHPDEEFSVSHYYSLARAVIADIHKRGKLPILVGGTGLYIKAVLDGIETIDIPRNQPLRHELATKSIKELQEILAHESANILEQMNNSDRNNPRRLIRKIEIVLSPQEIQVQKKRALYDALIIGLTIPSELLNQRIAERVQKRVDQGIMHEIKTLLDGGYSFDLPAMNSLGYKEWRQYVQNPSESSKQESIQEWIHDEISYTKRQMTWFKKQNGVLWFDIQKSDFVLNMREKVKKWYTGR